MNQQPTIPLFQILKRGPRSNKTVSLPLALAACSAGTAFMDATPAADQDASGAVALANGSLMFQGFITRDVLAAVNGVPAVPAPTYSELSTGGNPNLPFETQFSAGLEGSLEDAQEYEAEGSGFVSSGNGGKDITAATAIGSRLSFVGGVTCLAAPGSGLWSEFVLAEIETPSIAGNVRIRCEKVFGGTV